LGFSEIALPLTRLTRKGATFDWNTACEMSFRTLKEKLTSAPVLVILDQTQKYVVYLLAHIFTELKICSKSIKCYYLKILIFGTINAQLYWNIVFRNKGILIKVSFRFTRNAQVLQSRIGFQFGRSRSV
jgi:hypothetical protein